MARRAAARLLAAAVAVAACVCVVHAVDADDEYVICMRVDTEESIPEELLVNSVARVSQSRSRLACAAHTGVCVCAGGVAWVILQGDAAALMEMNATREGGTTRKLFRLLRKFFSIISAYH